MLTFSVLRTPRLQVELQELSARDAIALCQMPPEEGEHGATELLKRIVVTPSAPRRGQETDIRLWSVQERALAVAHYLAHVIGGDFKIGDRGKFSDYLMEGGIGSPPEPIALGEVNGKLWHCQPMLGWHSEAIERLIQANELDGTYGGWMVGALSVQVYSGEPLALHDATDAVIDAAVHERATALLAMPESDFMALVGLFVNRSHELDHIFRLSIGDDGIGFLPRKEVPGLPPARFHFSMAVRADTAAVFGPTSGVSD